MASKVVHIERKGRHSVECGCDDEQVEYSARDYSNAADTKGVWCHHGLAEVRDCLPRDLTEAQAEQLVESGQLSPNDLHLLISAGLTGAEIKNAHAAFTAGCDLYSYVAILRRYAPGSDMLTTARAAKLLSARLGRSYSVIRVQQLVRRGDFAGAVRPARDWLIPRESVEAWQPRASGYHGRFPR